MRTDNTAAPSDMFGRRAPAIYIHVPFCVSKCAYCDFYSLPCGARSDKSGNFPVTRDTLALQKSYVDALCRQLRLTSERYDRPKIPTVFIGGGTPSLLRTEDIKSITDTLYTCFDVPESAEFTIEANPETLNSEKLKAYREMGINRLSIGMQSAVESELKALSRIHTHKSVVNAVKSARSAGFDNINLDLMYALPGQTEKSFGETLTAALTLSPEHISVYGLQLEEGTPLFKNRKKLSFPDDVTENKMNALALEILSKNGYRRYEISNYSKAGYECKHNLTYWTLGEYFGFGTAAHSFKDGKRYSIKKDIYAYCASPDFSDVTETEETLTKESLTEEYIMLSLRLCRGLSLEKLSKLTEDCDIYLKRAEPFIKGGFMELYRAKAADSVSSAGNFSSGDTLLRFTSSGFNVSNTILSEIIYG